VPAKSPKLDTESQETLARLNRELQKLKPKNRRLKEKMERLSSISEEREAQKEKSIRSEDYMNEIMDRLGRKAKEFD
jgi:predicted transcriptional regulator